MQSEGYDSAEVCLNGHCTNSSAVDFPLHSKKHCDRCGAETIKQCQHCRNRIRGYLRGSMAVRPYEPPAFCHTCGKAYPWTESRLEAARDLANQLGFDIPERTLLEKSIEELVRDTPRAPAEAVRFKTMVEKAQPWALGAFKEILYGVVGESVKRMIWP